MKWNSRYILRFLIVILVFLNACSLDPGQEHYERGIEAYNSGDYRQAAKDFYEALENNGDKAEYYLYYGFSLIELGRYDEAAQNFECVILDKEFQNVQENNKKAYRGAGIAYYLAGNAEQALSCFYAALNIDLLAEYNDDIRAYIIQANTKMLSNYQKSGELSKALLLCEQLLAEFGESMDLYRMRADIYIEQEQYEEALKEFELAIQAGDHRMGTHLGKLLALRKLGRTAEAEEVIAELSKITPTSDQETLSKAIVEFSSGDYNKAEKTFLELHEKGFQETSYYLAQICIEKGDDLAAEGYLMELVDADLQNAELYYQLAAVNIRLDRVKEAKEYYEKLVAVNDAAWQRGQDKLHIVLLEKQGMWDEAYFYMKKYMQDYITQEDKEYEEARKEYLFLERIIKK